MVNVELAAKLVREAAAITTQITGEVIPSDEPGCIALALKEPVGVIQSGICHVNGPTVHDEPQMPFGGVGASGHGRFGGRQGVDSFTETRWITIETLPGQFPI